MNSINYAINYALAPCKVAYNKTVDYISFHINQIEESDVESLDYQTSTSKRLFPEPKIINKCKRFFSEPTHIIDNIYLGSAFNAASYYKLKELNVGLIINVTHEISQYYPNDFTYIQYHLYDNNRDSINNYLDKAFEDITKYQKNTPDKNIFIHCFMGASRSASILINYLMKTCKTDNGDEYTFNDAVEFLRNKRDIINPSLKFTNELKDRQIIPESFFVDDSDL